MSLAGPYNTGIGVSASLNPGISFKHFYKEDKAFEILVGTRWKGISVTGLYLIGIGNAGEKIGTIWNFGGGPRLGFYDGESHRDYLGTVKEPHPYSMIGLVGSFGIEYYLTKAPISLAFDFRPYYDLKGDDDSMLDAAITLRFVFGKP